MEFLRKLFGRGEGAAKGGGVPPELVDRTDAKLALVRHLATSRPFTRDGMTKYISLLEKSGVELPPHRRSQMLDSGSLVMPKRQADGTMADGYEQYRVAFLCVHVEELTEVVRILKQLPPHASTLALLKRIVDAAEQYSPR